MPIEFKVIYNDNKSNVEIKLVKLFNIRIDIDQFIKFLLTTRGKRDEITLDSIIYNFTIFMKSRRIIRWICHWSYIKKITAVVSQNYDNYFMVVQSWTILSYIRRIAKSRFYKVYDEHYMVANSDDLKVQFEVIIEMRIIFAIMAIIFNIKDIFKLRKFMKVYYGKSNL